MFCFVIFGCCLLEACSFLKGNGGGVSVGWGKEVQEDLGGVRGKTVVRMCCMREESILNLKKRKLKKENGDANSHLIGCEY